MNTPWKWEEYNGVLSIQDAFGQEVAIVTKYNLTGEEEDMAELICKAVNKYI